MFEFLSYKLSLEVSESQGFCKFGEIIIPSLNYS